MKRLSSIAVVVTGIICTTSYAGCPLDGYSKSFKVRVNNKLVRCKGTQIAYFSAGAITGSTTAVCSKEKVIYPHFKKANWVATLYEGKDGTLNLYGMNCNPKKGGEWNCNKWIKNAGINIEPGKCIEYSNKND